MKILQVVDLFSPVHGGSAEVPYQLSRQLAKKGHEVTVFTSDHLVDMEKITAIPGRKIQAFKTVATPASFFYTPALAVEMEKDIGQFDIVHLHNFRTYQNIVASRCAGKWGKPYVLQAHGSLTTFSQKGALKRIYDILWGRRILKCAARLIACTGIEAEQYQSLGVNETRITVIPNGIETAEFDRLPPRGEFRKKYNLGDEKVVLYLGRIHKSKGLDLLVKAFAALPPVPGGARLVIVGPDGGYLKTLKRIIREAGVEERVLLTGPLYAADKLPAYVDADIFVNPCPIEIFGIVFLEALACGTPVVCSVNCGLAEVINGSVGLAAANNVEALMNAMLRLLDDEKLRREFGETGRRLVREKYDWSNIAGQVEQVYFRCLNR